MNNPLNRYVHGNPRFGRNNSLHAGLLFFRLIQNVTGLRTKPPVTLSIVCAILILFFVPRIAIRPQPHFVALLKKNLNVREYCLLPSAVRKGQYYRLLTSSMLHLTPVHVLYNSLSMLRVGVQLETIFGSLPFLYLVVSLACLSSSFHFLLSYALELVKPRTIHSCTAGLSGVIFALRALQGSDLSLQRRRRSFWGIPVPGGVWGEMILASILMPRVSFWGHFSGIVSGYCVAWLMKAFRRGWIRAEPWCFLIRRDILEPLVILLFVYLWTRYRAA